MTGHLPSAEVFIATSLDGYIARPDGNIDWLTGRPVPEREDFGYAAFQDGIGALVMGRESFEKVLTFPKWPYTVPVVVLSRTPERVTVPAALTEKVRVSGKRPRAVLEELGAEGVKRVYIDGGQTIRSFLAERLVRRMIVTLVPVLLGAGAPAVGAWSRGRGSDVGRRAALGEWVRPGRIPRLKQKAGGFPPALFSKRGAL